MRISQRDFLGNILICTTIILQIVRMITELSVLNILIVFVGGLQYFYAYKYKCIQKKTVVQFLSFMVLSLILSSIYNSNQGISGIINTVLLFSTVLVMLKTNVKVAFMKGLFWMFTIWCAFLFITKANPNEIFAHTSRNYISVVFIFLVCLIIFSQIEERKELSLIYAIIPVFFSVWAIGRSGILATMLLLVAMIGIKTFQQTERKYKFIWFLLFVIGMLVVVLLVFSSNTVISALFSRFIENGFQDQARNNIWTRYLDLLESDKYSILFGAEIGRDNYLKSFEGNLHNSFFSLHARYGIIYLLFIIYRIIVSMKFFYVRKNYMVVICMGCFLLRGWTDVLFCSYWGDIILWYFLLYPVVKKGVIE